MLMNNDQIPTIYKWEEIDELQYMPDKVFNYYILELKKYIEVIPLNADTASAVSVFLT